MVYEGVGFDYKISERGIEVDKAKIEAIERIPYPRDIKGICSFLGHAGFYRRLGKDFSKTSRPLTILLQKDVPFVFDEDCKCDTPKIKPCTIIIHARYTIKIRDSR